MQPSEVPRLDYSVCAYGPDGGQLWVEYAGKKFHLFMADMLGLTPRLESGELSMFLESNWWRYVTLDHGQTVMRLPGPWPKGLRGPLKPPMGRLATAAEIGRYQRMYPDTRSAKEKHQEYIAGEHVHEHPFEHQKDPEESAFVVNWHACVHKVVERIDPNKEYPSGLTDSESSDDEEEENKENTATMRNRALRAHRRDAYREGIFAC
jgi:hypothetical protein